MHSSVIRVPDALLPEVKRLIHDWHQAQGLRPASADDLQPMSDDDWQRVRWHDSDWQRVRWHDSDWGKIKYP